jgi:hypothetical protein
MSWIAVGAAVAGTLVKTYNANKTADKKNAFLMENMRKQREYEGQANARAQAELGRLEQQLGTRGEESQREGQILRQLAAKKKLALAGMQPTGGGDDIIEEIGRQGATATGYGDFMADVISRIEGPGERRRKDAYKHADLSSFLTQLKRHSAADGRLTELGVASVRPNWLLNLLGEGLTAYGTSGIAGGLGGAGANPTGMYNPSSFLANYSANSGLGVGGSLGALSNYMPGWNPTGIFTGGKYQ